MRLIRWYYESGPKEQERGEAMITRKLKITDVSYRLDEEKTVRTARYFGKTNSHQFMRELMKEHPDQVVGVIGYVQYEKVYQIEEEEFIKHSKEID